MNTTSWMLPGILLESAGIGGDRYFATLSALRDQVSPDVMASSSQWPSELRALGQLRFRSELEPVIDSVLDGPEPGWDSTVAP